MLEAFLEGCRRLMAAREPLVVDVPFAAKTGGIDVEWRGIDCFVASKVEVPRWRPSVEDLYRYGRFRYTGTLYRCTGKPNFGRSALGCIEAYLCN